MLTALAPKTFINQNIPSVGQSLLIFGNGVKLKIVQHRKYFAFPEVQNSGISVAIPSRQEGRRPSSRTRDGLRWTPIAPLTKAREAYGEDVWS